MPKGVVAFILGGVVVAGAAVLLVLARSGRAPAAGASASGRSVPHGIARQTPTAPAPPESPAARASRPAPLAAETVTSATASASAIAVPSAAHAAPQRGPAIGNDASAEARRNVERFADASVPVARRLAALDELARKGDRASAETLMAVGDEITYLNYAAVEALGKVKTAEVAEYLAGKLADPDSRVLCAAVRSLAAVDGEKAVAPISRVLQANRSRPDGHHDDVCGACVEALGAIGSSRAIPALAAEFEQTFGVTLRHDYGSKLVKALKQIGDPAARPALLAYAERLAKEEAGMADNPMGQSYLQAKVKEARDAAESLRP